MGTVKTVFTSHFSSQQKQSGWDGGTRTNAVFYSPFLNFPGVVRNQLMHVSDLFPTPAINTQLLLHRLHDTGKFQERCRVTFYAA